MIRQGLICYMLFVTVTSQVIGHDLVHRRSAKVQEILQKLQKDISRPPTDNDQKSSRIQQIQQILGIHTIPKSDQLHPKERDDMVETVDATEYFNSANIVRHYQFDSHPTNKPLIHQTYTINHRQQYGELLRDIFVTPVTEQPMELKQKKPLFGKQPLRNLHTVLTSNANTPGNRLKLAGNRFVGRSKFDPRNDSLSDNTQRQPYHPHKKHDDGTHTGFQVGLVYDTSVSDQIQSIIQSLQQLVKTTLKPHVNHRKDLDEIYHKEEQEKLLELAMKRHYDIQPDILKSILSMIIDHHKDSIPKNNCSVVSYLHPNAKTILEPTEYHYKNFSEILKERLNIDNLTKPDKASMNVLHNLLLDNFKQYLLSSKHYLQPRKDWTRAIRPGRDLSSRNRKPRSVRIDKFTLMNRFMNVPSGKIYRHTPTQVKGRPPRSHRVKREMNVQVVAEPLAVQQGSGVEDNEQKVFMDEILSDDRYYVADPLDASPIMEIEPLDIPEMEVIENNEDVVDLQTESVVLRQKRDIVTYPSPYDEKHTPVINRHIYNTVSPQLEEGSGDASTDTIEIINGTDLLSPDNETEIETTRRPFRRTTKFSIKIDVNGNEDNFFNGLIEGFIQVGNAIVDTVKSISNAITSVVSKIGSIF